MPELPEVEVLVRHLAPLLRGRTIRDVKVRRGRVLRPTTVRQLRRTLRGARFVGVNRRAKYLIFELRSRRQREPVRLVGHLGMTGRMFVAARGKPLPKHAAVVLDLGLTRLVFEDTRYFGRLTLDTLPLAKLGPEPLAAAFTLDGFAAALKRSAQAIKVKLLDQSLVAGIGNIYASEALHVARISPRRAARSLTRTEVARLRRTIRKVLAGAIRHGSTVPLNFGGRKSDGLFYYGRHPDAPNFYEERLRVYDRAGKACVRCGGRIRRIVQAARSTYFCGACQR
jgi:formamidopyrimidine-DNA glycosylase